MRYLEGAGLARGNSARLDMNFERNAILMLKKRGFTRILDAEEKHLPNSAALIAALRRRIAQLGQSTPEAPAGV